MMTSLQLPEILKNFIEYAENKPSAHCYLTYQPANGLWSYFDGSIVDHVWSNFNNPMITTVLRLEPDAAAAALCADPPDALVTTLTRYAVLVASRPAHTGLHHFIDVPEPEQLYQERQSSSESVN